MIRYTGNARNHDRPTTYARLERRFKRRLDRRRNYCVIHGELCESGSWTQECSGCSGSGCDECGYQGKVRISMWMPVEVCEDMREVTQ